ncbi:MAG: ABC transporter substrate-binding protein [Treponema sp.]|jgi:putative aldouronate transport system substrate-binding protein|nr:ABC transporter substrate-binding protein [Treponema sp.]
MKRKVFYTALRTAVLGMMLLGVIGCSKQQSGGGGQTTSGGSSSSASAAGVPTLIWWQIGNTQAGLAEDLKVISDYTQEKIGVRVDIKQAGWGDAGQRFNTMINVGEYYDILFTDLGSYNRFVSLGAFADITDILPTEGPKLWEYIPDVLWDGVRVKGKIYSIPTYKDSSKTCYYFWDHAYVEKYGIDLNENSWAYLDQVFTKIKAEQGIRFYPFTLDRNCNPFIFDIFDALAADLNPLGVDLADPNRRVVNTLEDPRVVEKFRYLHKWYEQGIINPDANTIDASPRPQIFFMAQAWPSVAYSYATTQGIEKYDPVKFFGPSYSTASIQGSMNAISVNSKYKNEALKFLELVNTDKKLRDMIGYGIEGKHFEYVNNGTAVRRIRTDWSLVNYQEGTYFIETPEDTVPPGYWEEVRQLNAEAVPSVMLGFMMDIEPVQNEIANCRSVWGKYQTDLITGASDPDVIIPQIIAELKSAGFDKIQAEAQRQVDAFAAAK